MAAPHENGFLIAAEHTRRDWIDYPDAAGDTVRIEAEIPDTATVCHLARLGESWPVCGADVDVRVLELLCWDDLPGNTVRCERCQVWERTS